MKIKNLVILILIVSTSINLYSQLDSNSVYKNLEIKKFYSVRASSSTRGGKTTYKVNNKIVTQEKYDKYHGTWKDMETCCPCILKSYNENDILLSEAVSCTDCVVGYYKEFYPNGKLKLKGQFKENPTNNWEDIYKRGYCSVEDGKWLYYNNKGQINYIEIWDNGNFIEQKPKSKKVEIWKVTLSLNGIEIDTQKIALNEFNNLQFTPKYKNLNRGSDLKLKLRVSQVGYRIVEKEILIDQFNEIEIEDLIKKVGTGISEVEKLNVQIGVYEKDINIWNFYIKLKE